LAAGLETMGGGAEAAAGGAAYARLGDHVDDALDGGSGH
jgi:hypothetical protein